jgi:hypothetical protein
LLIIQLFLFFVYFIQHCIVSRPSYSSFSEDAGIETVTTSALDENQREKIDIGKNKFFASGKMFEDVTVLRIDI